MSKPILRPGDEGWELSEEQAAGKQKILSFLRDPALRTLVLKGHAGTGKSTLIQEVIKALCGLARAAFTAPTNKATKVLREMAEAAGVDVEHVATTYSLLGLVMKPNGDLKEISRGAMGSTAGDYDVIIIDECSMLSRQLMEYIDYELVSTSTKFIFMGDPLQLPPVGEEYSESFTKAEVVVELKEVVRQAAGNPIIQLTVDLRHAITDENFELELKSAKDKEGHGVYVLPKPKWESWMRAGFSSQAYADDGNAFRAIAWRNVTVGYLNDRVRGALYGESVSEPYLVGERVLTASPIQDEFRTEVLATTDSEGTVRSAEVITHPWPKRCGLGEFKVYHLLVWFDGIGMVDTYAMHPESERAVSRKLSNLSGEAKKRGQLWDTFWMFKESFHDVRPAHAITSHRSQGSTYDNAFVDVKDIFKNRNREERLKSLYVACSRARSNLMLLV